MAKLPLDVQNALKNQLPKAVRRDFEKEVRKEFKKIKDEMLKEFLTDSVTLEILEGQELQI